MLRFTRGSRIAIIGAIVTMVGFFSPWFPGDIFLYDTAFTGYVAARGLMVTVGGEVSRPTGGSPFLFVAPLASLATLVLSGIAYRHARTDRFHIVQAILGIMGLIAVLSSTGRSTVMRVYMAYHNASHEYGYYVTLLGLAAIVLGCLFFPQRSTSAGDVPAEKRTAAEQMKELEELRAAGLITIDEYNQKRSDVLHGL